MSILYLHHNQNGICIHGPGFLNSKCVTHQKSRIISDSRIQNDLFVCLNFTQSHISLAADNNQGEDLFISDQLRITAGIPSRITEENVGGELIFNEVFSANDTLVAANGDDFHLTDPESGESIFEKVFTSIFKPKYYAFASGESEVNLIRLSVLRQEISCTAGFYDNTGGKADCKPCRPGTFNNFDKAEYCLDCPVGTYQDQQGKTECLPCPGGRYNNEVGQPECTPCSNGSYASVETSGALTDEICDSFAGIGEYAPPGSIQAFDCEPGTYQPTANNEACIECPQGQYQPLSKDTFCNKCPTGTYGLLITGGSASVDDCQPCAAGSFSDTEGSASCTLCEVGYFGSQNEGSNFDNCQACQPGTVQPISGKSICNDCPPGTSQSESGQATCDPCGIGKYQLNPGQASCNSCSDHGNMYEPNDDSSVQNWGITFEASCNRIPCVCSNGIEETGDDCNVPLGNICESCDPTYHLDANKNCIENVCGCNNGHAVSNDQCLTHQANTCASCHTGYHLENQNCVPNICSCSNGVAVTGIECDIHNEHKCNTCNSGYHKVGQLCEKNVCNCPYENCYPPADGPDCPEHGAHWCLNCVQGTGWGFDVSKSSEWLNHNGQTLAKTCKVKQCYCVGGFYPAVGTRCKVDGAMQCSATNNGQHVALPGDEPYVDNHGCLPGFVLTFPLDTSPYENVPGQGDGTYDYCKTDPQIFNPDNPGYDHLVATCQFDGFNDMSVNINQFIFRRLLRYCGFHSCQEAGYANDDLTMCFGSAWTVTFNKPNCFNMCGTGAIRSMARSLEKQYGEELSRNLGGQNITQMLLEGVIEE